MQKPCQGSRVLRTTLSKTMYTVAAINQYFILVKVHVWYKTGIMYLSYIVGDGDVHSLQRRTMIVVMNLRALHTFVVSFPTSITVTVMSQII